MSTAARATRRSRGATRAPAADSSARPCDKRSTLCDECHHPERSTSQTTLSGYVITAERTQNGGTIHRLNINGGLQRAEVFTRWIVRTRRRYRRVPVEQDRTKPFDG